MNKAVALALIVCCGVGWTANASDWGSVSIGVHLNPSLERTGDRRTWDVSLSVSAVIHLDASQDIECTVMVDSGPTTLGTTVEYRYAVTPRFDVGGGLTVLWPFDANERLLAPFVESFAHGTANVPLADIATGSAGASFPVVTIAKTSEGWQVIPLSALPALSVSVSANVVTKANAEARLTLQPVIVDTTAFDHPIGRLTDNLLILPTYSGYVGYLP